MILWKLLEGGKRVLWTGGDCNFWGVRSEEFRMVSRPGRRTSCWEVGTQNSLWNAWNFYWRICETMDSLLSRERINRKLNQLPQLLPGGLVI